MVGLEAIAYHNGWTIAATGACIVFSGLAVLSLVISQLHKLVALLDRPPKSVVEVAVAKKPARVPPPCPNDLGEAIRLYQPLLDELPPEFELPELYELARKYHLPHPHLSIRCLRDAGRLEFLGDGLFRFQP